MRKSFASGFTLIELSLSLIFISILSLTVVLLIQNTTASYRRGLILNEINTVGMDLVDDMRMSVQNASTYSVIEMCRNRYPEPSESLSEEDKKKAPRNKCIADNATSFVKVVKIATVNDNGTTISDMPVYGAFCTGTYTYIWNSGYFYNGYDNEDEITRSVTSSGKSISKVVLKEKKVSNNTTSNLSTGFRLLKIYDGERTICVNAMKERDVSPDKDKYVDFANVAAKENDSFVIDDTMKKDDDENSGKGVEMLEGNNKNDLVLYDLYVAEPALSATRENLFYSVAFILGTRRGGVNVTRAGNSCKPPSGDYSELEYCAINKFNFAVEAGGR